MAGGHFARIGPFGRTPQRILTAFALSISIAFFSGASGATARRDATDYHRTWFSPAQGSPVMVYRLAQTADGFLWLGTKGGLFRFDGVRFERIESVGTSRLLGDDITALMAPRSGGLWIGYEYGGISYLNGNELTNFPLKKGGGLPAGTVSKFAMDADAVVWATTTRGLARFDGQRWSDVTETLGLPTPYTIDLLFDKAGNLWIRSGDKVAVLHRGSARVHVYGVSITHGFLADPAGRVWTHGPGTPFCLYLLDPTRDEDPVCRPASAEYEDLWLFDQAGNLWGADPDEHLRILPIPTEPKSPAAHAALPLPVKRPFIGFSGQLIGALEDREGNLWFGTTNGLEQLRVSRLESHGPLPSFVVIAAGNHDSVWLCTSSYNPQPGPDFFQIEDGQLVPHVGGPTMLTGFYRDSTGVLWVGGQGRLWKLSDSSWEEVAIPPEITATSGDPRRRVQAIARDASGSLWLSLVRDGLFKLQDGRWDRVVVPGMSASDYPTVMLADARGAIWLGYPHANLATFAQGTWKLYTELEGVNIGNTQVLSSIQDEVWIGGDQGLGRIHSGRFEPLPALASLGGVTGLLQGKNGDLWLSTSVGAAHMSKSEIERFALDPKKIPSYEILDYQDGMPGVALGSRPLPTVLESDDGRIWFQVGDHYAFTDPLQHSSNAVPPTVIIRSITDDKRSRVAPQRELLLFPNVQSVEIDYTATSLSIPSRVRFKYRLEGFEPDWQDVGARRAAYYNNLPPGHYVFHVIAANDTGLWNTEGATLSLTIPALVYQTVWFRLLCVTLFIASIVAIFSWRLRLAADKHRKRLEQRMEDRLNERTRIARDVHDSLLQGVQGLMFRLQAVRQLLPARPGDAAQQLDSALQVGDRAISDGRETVYNLRSAIEDQDLSTSLKAVGAEFTVGLDADSKAEYQVIIEGQPRELVPTVRDDVYRIVREAVRNAYQHAKAHHITIEILFGDIELSICVRDDGIGVDPEILARGSREGHWGLLGIRERSESLGGHLEIRSDRNVGTEIHLRIAAKIAYASEPIPAFAWLRHWW